MTSMGFKYQFYIIHSSRDESMASKITDVLNDIGIPCFGEDCDDYILGARDAVNFENGVKLSRYLVPCFTRNFFRQDDRYVLDQVKVQLEDQRRQSCLVCLKPLVLEKCKIPIRWKPFRRNRVDISTHVEKFKQGFMTQEESLANVDATFLAILKGIKAKGVRRSTKYRRRFDKIKFCPKQMNKSGRVDIEKKGISYFLKKMLITCQKCKVKCKGLVESFLHFPTCPEKRFICSSCKYEGKMSDKHEHIKHCVLAQMDRLGITNEPWDDGDRQVTCPHPLCSEIIALSYLDTHTKSCRYRSFACKNSGCPSDSLYRWELATHNAICPYYKMTCKCGVEVLRDKMAEHEKICDKMTREMCLWCGQFIRVYKDTETISLQNHKCPKRLVKCSHCDERISADAVMEHMKRKHYIGQNISPLHNRKHKDKVIERTFLDKKEAFDITKSYRSVMIGSSYRLVKDPEPAICSKLKFIKRLQKKKQSPLSKNTCPVRRPTNACSLRNKQTVAQEFNHNNGPHNTRTKKFKVVAFFQGVFGTSTEENIPEPKSSMLTFIQRLQNNRMKSNTRDVENVSPVSEVTDKFKKPTKSWFNRAVEHLITPRPGKYACHGIDVENCLDYLIKTKGITEVDSKKLNEKVNDLKTEHNYPKNNAILRALDVLGHGHLMKAIREAGNIRQSRTYLESSDNAAVQSGENKAKDMYDDIFKRFLQKDKGIFFRDRNSISVQEVSQSKSSTATRRSWSESDSPLTQSTESRLSDGVKYQLFFKQL